jgi:hypothetical protein
MSFPPSEAQLWAAVQKGLGDVHARQTASVTLLKDLDSMHTSIENNTEPFPLLRPKVTRIYQAVRDATDAEEKCARPVTSL